MKQESPRLQPWGVSREIPERQPDRPGRGHHRPDRPRRPPRRHHQTEMGLSNGLCSNHVGWSQSSRTHSSGAAAQIERPEVRTIACGHRVHNHVLGAGFVAVVPRPIRFGRNFLMDLSNRAVRPPGGFCTDCGAYAALGENDRCAACDAWRHREEERRDHV